MKIVKSLYYLALVILFSCQDPSPKSPWIVQRGIVQRADYLRYLSNSEAFSASLNKIDRQIDFWNQKLASQQKSHLYLAKQAGLMTAKFKRTGNIQHLYASDSILLRVGEITGGSRCSTLHLLAANAITRHEFKPALHYLETAWKIGENKQTTLLMAVDVLMELGHYQEAQDRLSRIENKSTFDYLIRLAKIKDHQGRLPEAISIMEKAFNRIRGNRNLYCWALSNLGDMYGHAGRIRDAYQSYLKVLQKDPGYHYALQGIAWIAYSHDHNTGYAREILEFLKDKTQLPHLLLLEAEIAEFSGDLQLSLRRTTEFYQIASDPQYRQMYNKYLCLAEIETFNNYNGASALARQEIDQRPTPQSFDLLAWNHLQRGDVDKAYELAETKIKGRSQEPGILYHLGAIYLMAGKTKQAREYLSLAHESCFELGPITTARIEALLSQL